MRVNEESEHDPKTGTIPMLTTTNGRPDIMDVPIDASLVRVSILKQLDPEGFNCPEIVRALRAADPVRFKKV